MSTDGHAETRKPSELHTFHRNPRIGDTEAIAASLRAHGQYKPIVVNKGTHTGRPDEVLAGNHTLSAIRSLAESDADDPQWQQVHTWNVDVDEDIANRIVIADNRTADLGGYDNETLLSLLQTIEDTELPTVGYDEDGLNHIVSQTEVPSFEPQDIDMPRLDQYSVTDCPNCGHTFAPETRTVRDQ